MFSTLNRFAISMCIVSSLCLMFVLSALAASNIEKGDLVTVEYTAKLGDGKVFYTTMKDIPADLDKADWFKVNENPGPQLVVAGERAFMPGLGENLVGMAEGQTKTITLKPEEAFGKGDPNKIRTFPREAVFPKTMKLDPREFVGRFGMFPVVGSEVALNDHVSGIVDSYTEQEAVVLLSAEDGKVSEDGIGQTTVMVTDDEIKLLLEPAVGAVIPGANEKGEPIEGRIASVDEKSFTVDYNAPVLGKTIVLDLEVVDVTEGAEFSDVELDWREAGAGGLDEFTGQGKPVFVVMHRDGCGWCDRYFNETLTDKRILTLRDEFVWVKVDTGQYMELGKQYGLKGTPLTVVLDDQGNEIAREGGFQQAALLYPMLQELAGK